MDARLASLIARATATDGYPPFSDGSLLELGSGQRRAVWLDDVAVALVNNSEAEFVVDPPARRRGHGRTLLHRLLLDAPGDLLIWAHGAHPGAVALAARFGLQPERQLLQMHLALADSRGVSGSDSPPVSESGSAGRSGSRTLTRGLRGNENAWLGLNARAFATHPEQGAVTRADLDALRNEPWFDDDDVLLLWTGDALVGCCWLKTEGHSSGKPVGEFYVVGVDPDHQGAGIGRELVAAGLAHLVARNIPEAHLYVEGDNSAAVRLYRSFGFKDYALDIQYRGGHEPDGPAPFST